MWQQAARQVNHLEAELASAFSGISLQEKKIINDDIHGVSEPTSEAPEFVALSVEQLKAALEAIPASKKTYFSTARTQDFEFVENAQFNLMFLRAKQFDIEAAALQMVSFFEIKSLLFGEDNLTKHIQQRHLEPEALQFLASGNFQILPSTDCSGRAVGFVSFHNITCSREAVARVMFYQSMLALESEAVQKKGAVVVDWTHQASQMQPLSASSSFQSPPASFHQLIHRVVMALPLRPVCAHICGPYSVLSASFQIVLKILSRHMKVRARIHTGSPLECVYALEWYGIPRTSLPINEDRNDFYNRYLRRLEMRRNEEETLSRDPSNSSLVEMETVNRSDDSSSYEGTPPIQSDRGQQSSPPRSMDVLFGGKGQEVVKNPGNMIFRDLLEMHIQDYFSSKSKKRKGAICRNIMVSLQSTGTKFYHRKEAGEWEDFEDQATIHKRITHAFRNLARMKKYKHLLKTSA